MFESHVTVEGSTDEEFKSVCAELGVKPVIIEDDTGAGIRQMMTAKFHKTTDFHQAMAEMNAIASRLPGKVIRRKIEKIIGKRGELPEHKYLEFHLKYEVPIDDVDKFVDMVRWTGGHTAKNVLKQTNDPATVFQFATARDLATYNRLMENLREYRMVNSIMECVIMDDNPNIDTNWHGCDGCGFKSVPAFLEAV